MDALVAAAVFECGNEFVNGDVEMINGTVVPGVASAKVKMMLLPN